MRRLLLPALAAMLFATSSLCAADPKPIKALLVLGGCCHDYKAQQEILKKGLEARAHVEVTIVYSADSSTKATFEPYKKADWAKGYDVVIHDECSADVKDAETVGNILGAHKAGLPAVNLHCAMHSYRTGKGDWFEFIGIESTGHGPQVPISITFIDKEHPITKGMADWKTVNEELYNNVKILKTATSLARGSQELKNKTETTVVVWTNDYHGTRVFNTTLGHNNATVGDARYLDLLAHGLLWATDKLNDTYLKPAVKEIPKKDASK
ncbi:ThuA domain-containing protein [Zavarzinella formosa]|uniref:ThuA domain-containing protein n=1 Tax=Zavarzinella formosa TaxID=360055 RepID=UPI000594EEC3|nr:ThuA domain-containing protein [Zavarzinella formosa]